MTMISMAIIFGPYGTIKITFSYKTTLFSHTKYKNLTNIYEKYILLQMMSIVTTYFSKME
jgi:hypothetical protein